MFLATPARIIIAAEASPAITMTGEIPNTDCNGRLPFARRSPSNRFGATGTSFHGGERRPRSRGGRRCLRCRLRRQLFDVAPEDELPDLGGDEDGRAGAEAQEPLAEAQTLGVKDALEDVQLVARH